MPNWFRLEQCIELVPHPIANHFSSVSSSIPSAPCMVCASFGWCLSTLGEYWASPTPQTRARKTSVSCLSTWTGKGRMENRPPPQPGASTAGRGVSWGGELCSATPPPSPNPPTATGSTCGVELNTICGNGNKGSAVSPAC